MPTENPTHDDHSPSADGHSSTAAEIVSHIADGLRSNLDPAALNLELLRRRLSSDQGSLDMLEQVDAALLAVDAMLHLNCTPGRHLQLEPVSLRKLLDEVYATLATQLSLHRVAIITDVPASLSVVADRPMLRAALLNLTLNALAAMESGGNLVVTSYVGLRGLELEFADSRPGLAEELRDQAFESFWPGASRRLSRRRAARRHRRGPQLSGRGRRLYLAHPPARPAGRLAQMLSAVPSSHESSTRWISLKRLSLKSLRSSNP
jgi:signal transduction histidine kinase